MCELGVFPIFLENDLLKVDKILGLTFFRQKKASKDSKRLFSIYCNWVLWSMDCLQLPFIRVEEAVSWTQRFLTRTFGPKIEVYLCRQTNLKANVYRHSTFQVNRRKNATWRRRSYLEEHCHFCQLFKRRTTQQTFSAINLASEQKITKLSPSSQVRKQFKQGSI